MDKAKVLEIIDRFRAVLEEKGIGIQRIVLYGSYAAGKEREGSDIDLVVISDDFSCMDYWQRIDMISDAIYKVFKPIEAMAMTSQEWRESRSIAVELARQGEVIFAA